MQLWVIQLYMNRLKMETSKLLKLSFKSFIPRCALLPRDSLPIVMQRKILHKKHL